MRRLFNEFQRFGRDERGAFAVLFGIMAIVLIATSGAVVDFTSLEQARTRSQTALDAAALALQPQIYTLPAASRDATLKGYAQTILNERLDDTTITATVTTVTSNTVDGTLKLNATVTKGTAFVSLIGIPNITAQLVSEATRRQLDLEVAMVLDNSISMDQSSRMTNLKKAARCATNILLNSISSCTDAALTAADALAPTVPNTKIGIVPFTEFVNVGSGNKTAAWMLQNGNSDTSRDNFDDDDNEATTYTGSQNRFSLYTQMGITWSGCVEARNHTLGSDGIHYYDTSDLPADSLVSDSMFVPIFVPDAPDSSPGVYANNYMSDRPSVCTNKDQGSWIKTSSKTNCTANGNNNAGNYNSCGSTPTVTYSQKNQNGGNVTPAATTEPATINGQPAVCTDGYTSTRTQNSPARYTNTWTHSCSYTFSQRELQERLCKYNTTTNQIGSSSNFQAGPNGDCGVALLPLTATKSSIVSKITAMGPDGGTNIHQGVMWGYHMLSPTAPLTEAKVFAGSTSKVMIVMTDGENTAGSQNPATDNIASWQGAEWYLAYGLPYNNSGRISGATRAAIQTVMDTRTTDTCTNAKAQDIVIYTIGLSPPNQSTRDMLTACATDAAHAYFPASATDLVATFQTIASQLADLRLAK
ncbi:MAG TPA: pilus assembly protein TadG-related protein [Devosia sp.]|nr:pilus assembly protein TadG-related protein [Devosia sp.]